MRAVFVLAACLLPPTLAIAPAQAVQSVQTASKPAAQTLTLYRCVDSHGVVSLQDAPCAAGQAQQVRSVTRPRDPPPRPAAATPPPPAATASASAPVQVVYRTPPRPLYECLTPDGERYLSDDDRGNPRWVPQWAAGYPSLLPHPRPLPYPPVQPLQADVRVQAGAVTATGRIGTAYPSVYPSPYPPPVAVGGAWVRDDCAQLPQADVCAHLRDRRAALRTRFFNAQEKERDVLRREEHTLNARLDNDCGGR